MASVYQMCKSGNTVVFTEDGGTVINMKTGNRLPITQRNGAYEVNMWVPAHKEDEEHRTDRVDALLKVQEASGENQINMDFIRRG